MKKSIVISLLTVTTLLCTAICSFASTGIVTTDTLRLREDASTDSSILTLLSINDKVEILGEEKNGWYKVKSGEYVGYVAAQYINVLTESSKNNETLNEDINKQTNENINTDGHDSAGNNIENSDNEEKSQNAETKTVLASGENLYITPVINSLIIYTFEEEKQIEVVSEINGWSYIKMGTTSGWVRTQNIQIKEVEDTSSQNQNNNSSQKFGYITINEVNFRKGPNTSAEIIAKLSRNAKVTIITDGETWVEIEYNGNRGYVAKEYVSDTSVETTSRGSVTRTGNKTTKNTAKTSNSNQVAKVSAEETEVITLDNLTGEDVVAYAKKYLGYRYVSGGSSPSRGFDCSGFTTYIYKHFGISLSRTSKGQASNGSAVSKSDMKLGDIICFSSSASSKSIGHVGIYVGGGKFIHSANSRNGVIISNVSGDGYYFVTARRVI